eukprot:GFYU01001659.1.p1 GENE.GFYU01001659.1~~GFYU01001659.1.p1  ORF type:complete len:428 (-),score=75.80 GFYU01001659.1:241-1524(-)
MSLRRKSAGPKRISDRTTPSGTPATPPPATGTTDEPSSRVRFVGKTGEALSKRRAKPSPKFKKPDRYISACLITEDNQMIQCAPMKRDEDPPSPEHAAKKPKFDLTEEKNQPRPLIPRKEKVAPGVKGDFLTKDRLAEMEDKRRKEMERRRNEASAARGVAGSGSKSKNTASSSRLSTPSAPSSVESQGKGVNDTVKRSKPTPAPKPSQGKPAAPKAAKSNAKQGASDAKATAKTKPKANGTSAATKSTPNAASKASKSKASPKPKVPKSTKPKAAKSPNATTAKAGDASGKRGTKRKSSVLDPEILKGYKARTDGLVSLNYDKLGRPTILNSRSMGIVKLLQGQAVVNSHPDPIAAVNEVEDKLQREARTKRNDNLVLGTFPRGATHLAVCYWIVNDMESKLPANRKSAPQTAPRPMQSNKTIVGH